MEKTNTQRTYRMYGLTPYNISSIQAGIQFGHAVQEFNNEMFEMIIKREKGFLFTTPEHRLMKSFEKWAKEDKTFIVLNGGTTNSNSLRLGTLNQYLEELATQNIFYAAFYEPDLGDQLTSFVFLVDDRVFDRVAWPDYSGIYYADGITPDATEYYEWKMKFADTEEEANQIVFLREWLPKFKLA